MQYLFGSLGVWISTHRIRDDKRSTGKKYLNRKYIACSKIGGILCELWRVSIRNYLYIILLFHQRTRRDGDADAGNDYWVEDTLQVLDVIADDRGVTRQSF